MNDKNLVAPEELAQLPAMKYFMALNLSSELAIKEKSECGGDSVKPLLMRDVTSPMPENDAALKLIEHVEQELEDLRGMANRQYSQADCPIREKHYERSWLLFGQGQWRWNCEFCGKKEEA